MTAPVDPVEVLAQVLFEVRQRVEYPGHESRWDDWKDGQDGDTSRKQAREALAHVRGLVPSVEELAAVMEKVAPVGCSCGGTDIGVGVLHEPSCGWLGPEDFAPVIRAETLRRLGGDP